MKVRLSAHDNRIDRSKVLRYSAVFAWCHGDIRSVEKINASVFAGDVAIHGGREERGESEILILHLGFTQR